VFKEALLKYKELHGDCYVCDKYDTRNNQYSLEMRGNNILYKYVDCIRTGHIYQDQKSKDELEAMGFDFHKKRGDFELLKQTLLVYKEVHGDLLVPSNFIIPIEDKKYPQQMRGRAFGYIVHDIRGKARHKEHEKELRAIGFDFSCQIGQYEEVKQALLAYKKLHRKLLVPFDFTIPEGDPHYPKEVWGMNLGNVVDRIRRSRNYEDHKEELLAMGFDFNKQVGDVSVLMEALLAYKRIFGNLNIPTRFVIRKDDKRFPESVRRNEKYNLGRILQKIRCLDSYTRLRKEFLEMGIEFTFQPVKFEVFKEALLKSTKSCMEIVMFVINMTQETISIQSK